MKIVVLIISFIVLLTTVSGAASDADSIAYQLAAEKTHLTFGLGIANDLIGGIVKNGMGEPKSSFSFNTFLGFSYTTYFGANSVESIFSEVREIYSNDLEEKDPSIIRSLVKNRIGSGRFSYFRVGTILLLYPLVLQTGWAWLPSENTRFEIGLGLPLVLNFGFNVDL